jgi:hypothetical protein
VKNVNFWLAIACHISKKLSGMCQSPSAIMSEASGLQKSKIHWFFLHLSYLPTDGRFDVAVNKNSKNHQFWSYWRPRPLKSCVLTCQTRSINNPVQFLLETLWKNKKSGQNWSDLTNLRSYIGFQGTQSCVFCLVIHLQVFSMTKFHSSSVVFIPKKIWRPLDKYFSIFRRPNLFQNFQINSKIGSKFHRFARLLRRFGLYRSPRWFSEYK